MIEKRKLVLVGTGFVGMSMAYSILNQGGVNELVLIDIAKEKAIGEAMDLAHGIPCAPERINIRAGEYNECKDADIVVITAGVPQKKGETRLELAKTNAKIIKSITKSVIGSGFNGIFIVASNPIDLMTNIVQKVSGFKTNKVIGSGTVLDTARLRYMLGEHLGINSKNIHAYIMGEHGDSSFVPWSNSYVGCKNLIDVIEEQGENLSVLDNIYTNVQQAAYEIINRKNATYYAIGLGLTKIVKAIFNDENEILTVSAYLNGEYNHKGMYIGVPSIINKNGVKGILQIKLNEQEQEKFDKSYNILNKLWKQIE